eukprot:Sdes_comp22296_c0_seq1m20776
MNKILFFLASLFVFLHSVTCDEKTIFVTVTVTATSPLSPSPTSLSSSIPSTSFSPTFTSVSPSSTSTSPPTPSPSSSPSSSPSPAPPSPSSDSSLSAGSQFLIWFFVISVVYLLGGIVWNIYQERSGRDIVPHYAMWEELFSLIIDGYLFLTGRRVTYGGSGGGYTSFDDGRRDDPPLSL